MRLWLVEHQASLVLGSGLPFGLLVGWLLWRAGRILPALDRWYFRVPMALVLLPLLLLLLTFVFEGLAYDGACSGWMEQGSHPCSWFERATQDYDTALLFLVPLSWPFIGLGMVFIQWLKRRKNAGDP